MPKPKAIEAVVTLLTDALAEAKAGNVASVAMVFVRPDGSVSPALATANGTAGDLHLAATALAAELLDEVRCGASNLTPLDEDDGAPPRIKLVGDN